MPQLRSYRSRRESTGSLSGMCTSAGLLRDSCKELLNLGICFQEGLAIWEKIVYNQIRTNVLYLGGGQMVAAGAADSLLCIKKEDASYKRYEN